MAQSSIPKKKWVSKITIQNANSPVCTAQTTAINQKICFTPNIVSTQNWTRNLNRAIFILSKMDHMSDQQMVDKTSARNKCHNFDAWQKTGKINRFGIYILGGIRTQSLRHWSPQSNSWFDVLRIGQRIFTKNIPISVRLNHLCSDLWKS